ncbi:MAG: Fic family protein [Ruminiclostridium sp.]|nr:Fic family protein [Ruminiclostridium sp.]
MEPKYRMTVEQNIFVARRNIIDYIWKSAKLEGLAVTYPDTEAIYNGMGVSGVRVSDIIAVNNLKHAWQFVLENLSYPIDYPYNCKINQLVGGNNLITNAGFLRNVPVTKGGTSWRSDIPIEPQIEEELSGIHHIENPTDRAITLMLYLMRKKMFLDGNKRTSMLAGNQVMISSGCGVISVPIDQQKDFTTMIVQFYESDDMEPLKAFVYDYCIDGISFEPVAELETHFENDYENEDDEDLEQ